MDHARFLLIGAVGYGPEVRMGDTHPRNHVVLCLAMIVVPVGTAPAIGQVEFVEVGASRGIEPYCMASGMGGGVAAADFDDDGDIDLFVPNGLGVPDQLYRNTGDGRFEEIAAAVGLASTARNHCALWLDYDGGSDLGLRAGRGEMGGLAGRARCSVRPVWALPTGTSWPRPWTLCSGAPLSSV